MAGLGGASRGPQPLVGMVSACVGEVNSRSRAREAEIWGFWRLSCPEMKYPGANSMVALSTHALGDCLPARAPPASIDVAAQGMTGARVLLGDEKRVFPACRSGESRACRRLHIAKARRAPPNWRNRPGGGDSLRTGTDWLDQPDPPRACRHYLARRSPTPERTC
jgi:hypothetical protein